MTDEGRTTHPILIFFVFALAGPPIGLLSAVLFEIIGTMATAWFTGRRNPLPLNTFQGFSIEILFSHVTLLFLAFAYLFGGLQAAFTGAVTATWSASQGRLSLKAATLASLAAGLLFCAMMIAAASARPGTMSGMTAFVVLAWTAIHVAAGLGSWTLAYLALKGLRQIEGRTRRIWHDWDGYA